MDHSAGLDGHQVRTTVVYGAARQNTRACCCAVSFDGEFSNTTSIYSASGVIRKQW